MFSAAERESRSAGKQLVDCVEGTDLLLSAGVPGLSLGSARACVPSDSQKESSD